MLLTVFTLKLTLENITGMNGLTGKSHYIHFRITGDLKRAGMYKATCSMCRQTFVQFEYEILLVRPLRAAEKS